MRANPVQLEPGVECQQMSKTVPCADQTPTQLVKERQWNQTAVSVELSVGPCGNIFCNKISHNAVVQKKRIKADLNLFKDRLVPKMKLTLPIVQNIAELLS